MGMKISPSEKQQQLISATTARQGDKATAGHHFAKVLTDTVQKSAGPAETDGHVVRPSPVPVINGPLVRKNPDMAAAEGLLDALENYKILLADPQTSLRVMAPSIEKMGSLSKSAEPILDRYPDGHPVKMVLGEALVHISKEIERFRGGYYVDP
jgi:hypothetical protein